MLTQYIFWDLNGSGYWNGQLSWTSTFYSAFAMTADEASLNFSNALTQRPGGFIMVAIVSPL